MYRFLKGFFYTVLGIRIRIRIRGIRMFLALLDLHPDPLVTSTDPAPDPVPEPAPDPSIIKQKCLKNLDFMTFY
jgi:hypothetical protein